MRQPTVCQKVGVCEYVRTGVWRVVRRSNRVLVRELKGEKVKSLLNIDPINIDRFVDQGTVECL